MRTQDTSFETYCTAIYWGRQVAAEDIETAVNTEWAPKPRCSALSPPAPRHLPTVTASAKAPTTREKVASTKRKTATIVESDCSPICGGGGARIGLATAYHRIGAGI